MWVWYDPRNKYEGFLDNVKDNLDDDINVLEYDGSYIEMKHKIWKEDHDYKDRWLLYVPENRAEAVWLKDIHRLGKEYRPDINVSSDPAAQYLVTRTDHIPEEYADEWSSNEEKLTKAFFSVLFREEHYDTKEFIVQFLANPDNYIKTIEEYSQEAVWESILEEEYGIDSGLNSVELAKKLVFSELQYHSPINKYSRLAADKLKKTAELCRYWQNKDPYKYRKYIDEIEKEYDIKDAVIESKSLEWRSNAFKGIDEGLLDICTSRLLEASLKEMENSVEDLKPVIENRKDSFWYKEGYCDYWNVLEFGFEAVKESSKAIEELKSFEGSIDDLVDNYLDRWWKIDNQYRKYVNAHKDLMYPKSKLEEVGEKFTTIYNRYLKEINRIFTEMIPNKPYIGDLQTDFFNNITPNEGTAIIICDALRFEIAKDIESRFSGSDRTQKISLMSASIPSMTEFGMSALLPGELSYELNKDVSVKVDDRPIKKKSDRVEILEEQGYNVTNIHSILNKRIKSIRDEGVPPRVIYSSFIDEMGEALDRDEHQVLANITKHVKDVEKLIRRLINIGYNEFYITADHGFLYTEELPDELKVDPPQSSKVLKRRFAMLKNPNYKDDNLITITSEDLSKIKVDSSDITIAFPYGVACFKTKGGNVSFFHGGISIQELAIPLLTIKTKEKKVTTKEIEIEIDFPTKITNSIISIELTPKGQIPLGKGRNVILQAKIEDKLVSEPKKVEINTKKKENLRLKTGLFGDAKSLILQAIDEETQEILKEERLQIDLIIQDDMGFDVE